MNSFFKIILISLAVCLIISVSYSCSKKNNDSGDTTSVEESPAVEETREFFTSYYNELNNKNFNAVSEYFSEEAEAIKSKIDNFTFMASLFNVKYEISEVEATYLEDGNISATIITLITSENIDSGAVTVMKEPSYYLISKSDGKLIITSYSVGESEVVSMN